MNLTMPSEAPDHDAIADFKRSLPPSYGSRYTRAQVAAHARIAELRADSLVSVGGFAGPKRSALGLCVVAKDQAGLLATVSGGLAEAGYDISDAEAYTRTAPNGEAEAVDIFWVHRRDRSPTSQGGKLGEAEALELHRILAQRLAQPDLGIVVPSRRTPGGTETHVRFIESDTGQFSTLEVETDDHSGLLQTLASALFQAGVQINSSQIRTDGTRVFDRFNILELDGSPVSQARRLEIQVAVLGAIEPALGEPALGE